MTVPSFDPVMAVLLIPIGSAALLAILPGYRQNGAAERRRQSRDIPFGPLVVRDRTSAAHAVCAGRRPEYCVHRAQYLRGVHDQHLQRELHRARTRHRAVDAGYLRFYHAMYQTMMFGMNLAFVSNNIGLMWVAVEIATLSTVLMVGIYRTHAALEAAWKYFILGSVGIALRCSARSWSTWRRGRWSARVRTAWSGHS